MNRLFGIVPQYESPVETTGGDIAGLFKVQIDAGGVTKRAQILFSSGRIVLFKVFFKGEHSPTICFQSAPGNVGGTHRIATLHRPPRTFPATPSYVYNQGMRTLNSWLEEYSESHQNPTNKAIHNVCVPAIMLSVLGLLASIPTPWESTFSFLNFAGLVALSAFLYYLLISPRMAIAMVLVLSLMVTINEILSFSLPWPLWQTSLVIFVFAWIGQFVGHRIEGKKPSFFKDLQFLLIGPLWVMNFVFKKMGIRP